MCNEVFTSPRVPSNESSRPPFDVNRRIVNGFLEIGKGHAAIEQFSMTTGLPIMSTSTYSDHIKNIADDNVKLKEEILKLSLLYDRHTGIQTPSVCIGDDDILDLTVSYDGTWHKRGHTSNYGH